MKTISNNSNKRLDINKDWYASKDVRPKLFNIVVERDSNGGYRAASAHVLNQTNQHETLLQKVDMRDLVSDISDKGLFAL